MEELCVFIECSLAVLCAGAQREITKKVGSGQRGITGLPLYPEAQKTKVEIEDIALIEDGRVMC